MPRILGAALLGWIVGCGVMGAGPPEPDSYFPMEANRVWQYRLRDLVRNDEWPVEVRSRGPRFVPALGRVAVIFDEEYADDVVPVAFFLAEGFLNSDIGFGGPPARTLPTGAQPMRLLPMPPRLGARWSYTERIFTTGGAVPVSFVIHWSGDVQAIDAVEVPGGRFPRCLRVVSTAVHSLDAAPEPAGRRYVDWYAPGVGLVKSEYSFGSDSPALSRLELVRHYRSPAAPPDGLHLHLALAATGGRAPREWPAATRID